VSAALAGRLAASASGGNPGFLAAAIRLSLWRPFDAITD